jgi:hypothetical protein
MTIKIREYNKFSKHSSMGNCNFKTEKDKDSVAGKKTILIFFYSNFEESVPVPVRNRPWRLRQGVACGKEEGEGGLCDEGNVKG